VAEAWLRLDGKPFSLDLWPMHRAFYDGHYRRTLLKTSRQVAKSTTLANFSITECSLIPHFATMYVSPTKEQTVKFSTSRVGKVMRYSPIVSKRFLHPDLSDRVFHKQFTQGSEMYFSYAMDDGDRLRGPSTDRNCYDKDAYVLTLRGWVLVSELQTTDRVADVNDAGEVEWNRPTKIFTRKYTGPMVTLSHRGFHLRVTGDHKLWINYKVKHSPAYKQEDKYEFVPALDAVQSKRMGFKLTSKAGWKNVIPPLRKFEGTEDKQRNCCEELYLPYKPFARLVGWYISEGCVRARQYQLGGPWKCPRAIITQNESRGLKDILASVEDCGLPYHVEHAKTRTTYNVVIASETLGQYFTLLGKSRDKYIPREFFESAELLEQVLQGIYLGDASYHKGERWENGTLRTRSKRLAEDVQEAWLRLGRPAVIHTRMMAPRPGAKKEPLYEVCSYERDYLIFWRADFEKKGRVLIEDTVDEPVSCFTVKHHRPIVKGNFKSLPIIGVQCFDEVQDILYDPVIVIGNEMMADSDYAYETYAGTPKTMENTIQYLWELSTQTEWVMRCDSCGTYQYIDSENSIGKDGPQCLKCKSYLNPFTGQWIDMNPCPPDKEESEMLKGFHLSQVIMPRNVPAAMKVFGVEAEEKARGRWRRIITKYEDNPISLVRNEVLGVSDAIGTRMITKEELESLCDDRELHQFPPRGSMQGFAYTVGGVDWSGGGTKGVSRTVIWIWGYHPKSQKLVLLFYKVYPRQNPVHIIDEIAMICSQYQVAMVVGDAGEGHVANETLRSKIGYHRVSQLQYGSTDKTIYFNGESNRFIANRTTLIDNYFLLLKRKGVAFGKHEQMKTAIEDILNVFEEVTASGKKVWQHSAERPDDCLHAGLYAWIAHKIQANDLKFYQ
jgi:hypothetical protein